jgi:hypothetical protein
MHAGLPWGRGMRPRAKSIRYQPVVCWPESHTAGRKIGSSADGRPAGILLISRTAATPTLRAYQPSSPPTGISRAFGCVASARVDLVRMDGPIAPEKRHMTRHFIPLSRAAPASRLHTTPHVSCVQGPVVSSGRAGRNRPQQEFGVQRRHPARFRPAVQSRIPSR